MDDEVLLQKQVLKPFMSHSYVSLPLSFTPFHISSSWINTCSQIFIDHKELWQYMVGPNDNDSTELVEEFFSTVAAIMSGQLRSMVINSLQDFLQFFQTHAVGYLLFFLYFTFYKYEVLTLVEQCHMPTSIFYLMLVQFS